MSNYRRSYQNGGSWFFTVNLRNRRSDLLVQQTGLLKQSIARVKSRKPFHINAWVVLPEHMHCIWTLPEHDCDYSSRWRDIKKGFTRGLQMSDIWQPRFWEHTLRSEEDYRCHMDYIYINPLKHGWVKQVSDWPYSTFHRDVRNGLYPRDWAGSTLDISAGERLYSPDGASAYPTYNTLIPRRSGRFVAR